MVRKIILIKEKSLIKETLLYLLGRTSKDKEEYPEIEIYLSFEKSMTNSKSFFKKLCNYAFENNFGIMVDKQIFLPDGGISVISKENFNILLKEYFD